MGKKKPKDWDTEVQGLSEPEKDIIMQMPEVQQRIKKGKANE